VQREANVFQRWLAFAGVGEADVTKLDLQATCIGWQIEWYGLGGRNDLRLVSQKIKQCVDEKMMLIYVG
jgi:hypothetical protein